MFAPPAAHSSGPSAPPASMFDSVPGYEGTVAGGGGTVKPSTVPLLSIICHFRDILPIDQRHHLFTIIEFEWYLLVESFSYFFSLQPVCRHCVNNRQYGQNIVNSYSKDHNYAGTNYNKTLTHNWIYTSLTAQFKTVFDAELLYCFIHEPCGVSWEKYLTGLK